jgi:hypothetical protein
MIATSNRVERKENERNHLNLALIAEVKESSPVVDKIIARNNITDLRILEILHDIVISKKYEDGLIWAQNTIFSRISIA